MLPGSFIKKVRDVAFKKLDPLNANTFHTLSLFINNFLEYRLLNETRTKVFHKNISQNFRTEGIKHKSEKRDKKNKTLFISRKVLKKSDFEKKIILIQNYL